MTLIPVASWGFKLALLGLFPGERGRNERLLDTLKKEKTRSSIDGIQDDCLVSCCAECMHPVLKLVSNLSDNDVSRTSMRT